MSYMTLKEVMMIFIVITLLKSIHILLPIIQKQWIVPAISQIKHYIHQTAAYWIFVSIMVPLTICQMILDDGGPPPYVPKSQRWKAKLRRWRSKVKGRMSICTVTDNGHIDEMVDSILEKEEENKE
jgi:hypothetical protein